MRGARRVCYRNTNIFSYVVGSWLSVTELFLMTEYARDEGKRSDVEIKLYVFQE